MQDVGADNWEDVVLKSKIPVLVDFWAPWCPWCRMLAPLLKGMEEAYEGKMLFTMLNTADYPDVSARYGVQSLPTMVFFCGGRVVGELVGYMPEDMLKQEFDRLLSRYSNCLAHSSYIK